MKIIPKYQSFVFNRLPKMSNDIINEKNNHLRGSCFILFIECRHAIQVVLSFSERNKRQAESGDTLITDVTKDLQSVMRIAIFLKPL
jgi:hypothetical protein